MKNILNCIIFNFLGCINKIGFLFKIKFILTDGNGKIFYNFLSDLFFINSVKFIYNIINKKFFLNKYNIYMYSNYPKLIRFGDSCSLSFFLSFLILIKNFKINKNISATGIVNYKNYILKTGCINQKILISIKNKIKLIFIPDKNFDYNKKFSNKIFIVKVDHLNTILKILK